MPAATTAVMREQVIASHVAGLSNVDIAKQLNLSRITVGRIILKHKRLAPASPVNVGVSGCDQKAIKSVEIALDDRADSYKSASIAVQWLKGRGVLAPDNVTTLNVLANALPEAMFTEGKSLLEKRRDANLLAQDKGDVATFSADENNCLENQTVPRLNDSKPDHT